MAEAPVSAFISYSRTDSAFIDRLEADLRAYGFDTWVDRQHLEGGADWARQIEQQIVRCEALVVALSPDAITSTWVRREITFALNAGKRIIPIIARPVASTPIEIVDLQYIDLSADYISGLQDLRVALLKVRTLPPPPRPAQAPQPLLTLPDVSDPLKGLVEIPAPPPAPNPDLNALFMQAQSALARGNFDLAEALMRQITEQEPDFGNGLAGEELQRVRKQLEPIQIERLQEMADDAHTRGAWGQEIGALRALASRLPDDKTTVDRLSLAEECQKWAWLYDNARAFARSGDVAATKVALTQLWDKALSFGDPANIAPVGVAIPAPPARFQFQRLTPNQGPMLYKKSGTGPDRPTTVTKIPFSIGRRYDNDLVLSGGTVSAVQAFIEFDPTGSFRVRAANSSHGVYVGNSRISAQTLKDGDEIRIGDTVLTFRLPK